MRYRYNSYHGDTTARYDHRYDLSDMYRSSMLTKSIRTWQRSNNDIMRWQYKCKRHSSRSNGVAKWLYRIHGNRYRRQRYYLCRTMRCNKWLMRYNNNSRGSTTDTRYDKRDVTDRQHDNSMRRFREWI